MSNMFYDYLTDRITDFFRKNPPKPGEKFYIQLETEEQVKTLYNELKENIISIPFFIGMMSGDRFMNLTSLDSGR